MRMPFYLALIPLVVAMSSHADTQSTVPNAFAATAANGTFLGPLANSPRTYQLLIGESQLAEHVGNAITGFSFRLPASATSSWPAALLTYGSYDVRLSASVDPSARSLTFANNVVGAQTLVRSGPLVIGAGSFSSGSSPNAFGLNIGFDSGYVYGGGNLLIEIRHTGSDGASTSVDSVLASSPASVGYGTLFSAAWGSGYGAASGNQGNFSVLQLVSAPVPEPAAGLLLAAGLLGLAGVRARRAHRAG